MLKLVPTTLEGCEVSGFIYWDDDLTILGEDMLDVLLPTGVLVSCGWYPEGDANGAYRITASAGFSELMRIETRNVFEAYEYVEMTVRNLYGWAYFSSQTSSVASVGDRGNPVVSATEAWRRFNAFGGGTMQVRGNRYSLV